MMGSIRSIDIVIRMQMERYVDAGWYLSAGDREVTCFLVPEFRSRIQCRITRHKATHGGLHANPVPPETEEGSYSVSAPRLYSAEEALSQEESLCSKICE